jgi:Ser/Thr protein kinase RdoA (MazF antagonist)
VALAAEQVCTAVRTSWQCSPERCTALASGRTSTNWQITAGRDRFLAKRVPVTQRARLEAGLAAAERLEADGIPAGGPVRTADGALTVVLGDDVLALLRWVPGRSLNLADPVDQQWLGETLAGVHRSLLGFAHPGLVKFHWIRTDAAHLGIEPWVRPAVAAAVRAARRLCVTDQLTYGVLHGDPSPDEFRLDTDNGRVALLDWSSAGTGPLVYDLASAVMFAGGMATAAHAVDGYLRHGPVPKGECEAALPTMLRLRYAVQVDWLCARLAAGAATAADHDGLRAAGAALTAGD